MQSRSPEGFIMFDENRMPSDSQTQMGELGCSIAIIVVVLALGFLSWCFKKDSVSPTENTPTNAATVETK